ncbi:serine/threonine-protein kinase [Qipengyuania sp. JC766]|uniref:serine/threonine-protein kinase n=1 Tax=Qipengyuania sp. JC766 TaxID=3232139 RepID=UPI00345A7FF2
MTICANCGSENPAGASFCGACGKPMESPAPPPAGDLDAMQTVSPYETHGRDRADDTQGRRAKAQIELEEGTVFAGRYTIGTLLGRGGMGTVYRAIDRHGERDVALKLIRADRLEGEGAVQRLINEGVTTQQLSHDNIVKVYNVDEADGIPFVAMEFVEGTTLAEWHRKKMAAREQVPARVAARIVMAMLDGLEAAHANGVIHRDLKPQNVILTSEPDQANASLKILDFGIARAATIEESLSGTALGTEAYMAPEQRTDPDLVDESADLYALSKVFYKLLMDALPEGMWQPPSASRSDVSKYLDDLIYAGISTGRSGRPASVDEYRRWLLAAMNGQRFERDRTDSPVRDGPVSLMHERETRQQAGLPKPALYGLLGCGGLIALFVLVSIIAGLSNPELIEDEGTASGPEYSLLSGTWNSDLSGESMYFVVPPDGDLNQTETVDGVPVTMTGRFEGLFANYTYSSAPLTFTGTLAWDGVDCHLQNQVTMGGQTVTDIYHIDHAPGHVPGADVCPDRFD